MTWLVPVVGTVVGITVVLTVTDGFTAVKEREG